MDSNLPGFLTPFDFEGAREIAKEQLALEGIDIENDREAWGFSEYIIYMVSLLDAKIKYFTNNMYIRYAEGEFLDELVALAGLTRHEGSPPIAKAKITSAKDKKVHLEMGTRFRSDDGDIATLMKAVDVDSDGVVAFLESSKEGELKTTTLYNYNPDVEKVEMLTPFQSQSLRESDDELRERFRLAQSRFSTAGARETYEFYSKIPGVKEVKCYSEEAGKVLIIYDGAEGLDEKIFAVLEKVAPITDHKTVQKASHKTINPNITLTTTRDANFEVVCFQIRSNLTSYFSKLRIGELVDILKFYGLTNCSNDVLKAAVDESTVESLKSITKTELLVLGNVTFTKETA